MTSILILYATPDIPSGWIEEEEDEPSEGLDIGKGKICRVLERYWNQASSNAQVQRVRSVQRRAERMLNRDRSSRGWLWKSVTAAKQYKVTAKMKLEGKDLRKLESGVVRFMRYRWERGRRGLHTSGMLAYNWMAPDNARSRLVGPGARATR
jgi:hypothetical protein